MNKKLAILDIIFYMAIPFLIWNYGKEFIGEYLAMLLSTVPGIFYTAYRFVKEKQFNIAGLFIIGSLMLGTVVNLLSGTAEKMIINGVYLGLFYVFIHLITFIIRKPLALYFAVDFVYLQGQPRKQSKALFNTKGIFKWFQLIQLLFILRGFVVAGLKLWLLQKYGVEGYGSMIIYRELTSWVFSLLILGLYIYTNVPIGKYFKEQRNTNQSEQMGT